MRPILFVIGSARHSLAKWLTFIPDPVLLLYSVKCIQDSFILLSFTNYLDSLINPFLHSFAIDISSFFAYVPLEEIINILAHVLYDRYLIFISFPREVFIEFMQTATKSVEFSFNNPMYRQIGCVAKGSLGSCTG